MPDGSLLLREPLPNNDIGICDESKNGTISEGRIMTHRTLSPGRLIAATHNKGKVRELKDLFEPLGLEVVSAIDLDLPEPEETESSFTGNALLKARAAAEETGAPALSDDSGLSVTLLDGAPGIYSARWAGEPRDFGVAMARVEQELQAAGNTDRSAKFVCALAVVWPDGHEEVFEGEVHGERRGNGPTAGHANTDVATTLAHCNDYKTSD